jgi:RsiW-degrading membrane proteinase PrsW (M82 family)
MSIDIVFTILLAVVPSLILAGYVYYKDILEKEPLTLLISLFIFGVVSTVPSMFLEHLFQSMYTTTSDFISIYIHALFGVAVIEEGYKCLFTYLVAYKNKNFDHIYDGIVYSVFVSLGFATLENIIYVLKYGKSVALMRAIISVPAHAFYGVSLGYYMGKAKKASVRGHKSKALLFNVISVVLPILLHSIFDFLLLAENMLLIKIFYVFVVLLYIIALLEIKSHSKVLVMLEN